MLQYRDSDDLEVDIILEKEDGGWAAVEVKLGVNQIDDGADSLRTTWQGFEYRSFPRQLKEPFQSSIMQKDLPDIRLHRQPPQQ